MPLVAVEPACTNTCTATGSGLSATTRDAVTVTLAESPSSTLAGFTVSVMSGSSLVVPSTDADHGPGPSGLLARTCTRYAVLGFRPPRAPKTVVVPAPGELWPPSSPGSTQSASLPAAGSVLPSNQRTS